MPDVVAETTALLGKLRDRMRKDARVALLSYPHLSLDVPYQLNSLTGSDSYDAAAAVRAINSRADRLQAAGIAKANASAGEDFVTYIDGIKPAFAGREPDPSASRRNPDRWIHEFDSHIKSEWYHPNRRGHEAEKDVLVAAGPLAPDRTPATGGSIDLVFVVDTTGSMAPDIAAVRDSMTAITDQLAASTASWRIAVVSYRDFPARTGESSDYPSRVDLGFSSTVSTIRTVIGGLVADGGGDTPESALSGLDAGISLPWRPGVKKAVVLFTDAPALDPEPISGLTSASVAQHAFEVDPATINLIDVGNAGAGLVSLATRTGGINTTASTPAQVQTALASTISSATASPYAWAGGPYIAAIGDTVTFDASGSFDPDGTIVKYEWDFDGDGTWDENTTGPDNTHRYTTAFEGVLAVRVTDNDGISTVGTARTVVSIDGDDIPDEFDLCPTVADGGGPDNDFDSDGVGDACDPTPGFPEVDKAGVFDGDTATGIQYVMVAKDGGVFAPGGRGFYGTVSVRPGDGIRRDNQGRIIGASGSPLDSPVIAFAYTPSRRGYWLVQADGGVIPIGDAAKLGDLKSVRLKAPIVGATATKDGTGLYLVAGDGGIFTLGNAPFKGSLGGLPLNKPILGMGLDADGSGYLLVAGDGGVFAFDAAFSGSLGATKLNKPIVGMAVASNGGYVLAASDGGAFNYGTPFAGSLGNVELAAPIVGIAADPDGSGYWMAGADGGAFAFDATFFGSVSNVLLNSPISGIAAL